ncbi:MAG: Crp/Fnr family transcriptional regulator [Magnetospirillum sp.]
MTLVEREHLFHMGEKAEHFYLLMSGTLAMYRSNHDGEEKVYRIARAGDAVAEAVMFAEPCVYPLSAQALEASRVYRLSRRRLLEIAERSPAFAMSMLRAMAGTICQAINRIDLLTTTGAEQRLAAYLASQHCRQGTTRLTLPVNGNVLAAQLGVTPVTLSRQLSRLRQNGVISGQKRTICLLDVAALYAAAGLPGPQGESRLGGCHDLGEGMIECCQKI